MKKIIWRISALLIILHAFVGTLSAQQLFFQEYGVRDGLAASKVYSVLEDRNGKIWLGTVNGISLFDGLRFRNFSEADGIAPDGVRTIYQDSSGVVWFGHYEGGVTRYKNGSFEVFKPEGVRSTGHIYRFLEAKPGEMWIVSNGLGALHIKGTAKPLSEMEVIQYMGAEGLGDRVFDVTQTADGSVYFVTDVGIKKLENDGAFSFYQPGGMSNMFQLTCMLEDKLGMRWFGTHNGGLYKYAPGNSDIEIIDVLDGLAHNFVFCLHEDESGNIWAGTYGGGVSVISPNGVIRTMNSENGLVDNKIQAITTDRENNVLIGTNDNGLLVFKSFQFESFPLPDRMGVKQFNAIEYTPDGSLWVGTEKGLLRLDKQGANARLYGVDEGLGDPNVNDIALSADGTVWLGTEFGGVFSYSPVSDKIRGHFAINQYITQNKVTDLFVTQNGEVLWVGTLDGLLRINWKKSTLDRLSQRDGLNANHISAIGEAANGDLLVGFVGRGAVRISPDSTYSLLSTGTPGCFLDDREGILWIGMEGQGIWRFIPGTEPQNITSEEGLLTNAVATLNQDEQGAVWIGSTAGLTRFDKENGRFVHYTPSAGFPGVEIRQRASCIFNNEIWYGTANGLVRNKPALEKPENEPGPFFISEVRINGEVIDPEMLMDLSFNQNELGFSFHTTSLSDPESVRYQWYLEGYDSRWTEWSPSGHADYLGLPDGNYRFHVKAKNRWGVEKVIDHSTEFVINPPWYRSKTFYGASAAGLLIFLVLFIKVRERNLRREKRVLEEKVKERTREVVEKSEEIERKNNDILDSINYAKRIQDAILMPRPQIDSFGLEYLLLYKPKDIVSGDFYWFNQAGDVLLLAAADCTGHGVPGAFMSVVGHSLLDKIVVEQGVTRPDKILTRLSEGVERFLRQKENLHIPRDGMDVALVAYNTKTNELNFSGAFNPLYLVRNKEVIEFKADRFSVGSYQSDDEKVFSLHSFQAQIDDCIYIFSDGFVDQFGGPDYKKFKSRQFKTLLSEIQHETMKKQETLLSETLSNWMGQVNQLDDILVIGIRF